MNALTLKVSADRNVKKIKRDIIKEDLTFILPLIQPENNEFEKLLSAKSIEEQAQSLREIFLKISDEGQYENSAFVLVGIFIRLKKKSPLLTPVLKFLSSAPEHLQSSVQDALEQELKCILSKKKLSFEDIAEYSLTIAICLENTLSHKFSFLSCQSDILKFIRTSLSFCLDSLKKENVPVEKLSIINGLHGCIQAAIIFSQKNDLGPQEELCNIAVSLLCEHELPLDSRSAAGILVAHLAECIGTNHSIMILDALLTSSNHDDLSLLAICSGLLIVWNAEILQSTVSINGRTDHAIYLLYNIIKDPEESNASESGVILAATRCILVLTRRFLQFPSLLNITFLNYLLEYVWTHIDHHMDAVKHLAISALSNIAAVGSIHPELQIFETISRSVEIMQVERRSKHAGIAVLISHVSVESIIKGNSGLVRGLFEAALTNPSSNYAVSSIVELTVQDFKETKDKEKWFDRWVRPIVSSKISPPIERLLAVIVKIDPSILKHIVTFNSVDKNIAVILTCLKIGKKCNLIAETNDDRKWKGLVDIQFLEKCMVHCDDDIRLACLALLVDTTRSTEEFTTVELDLIKTYILYNFVNEDAAVRQKCLASCKKLFTRLKDSRGNIERERNKQKNAEMKENLSCLLVAYTDFVVKIKNACIDSLFPGASPARRASALGLLAVMRDLGFWANFDIKSAQVLFSCILDSYEENKLIARNLLLDMPPHILKFDDTEHVQRYIRETLLLSSSIRPPDSISAAYFMSLLASHRTVLNTNFVEGSLYACLGYTLEALENDLKVAKQSLLRAASSGPLYGHLFIIRHLLQDIDFKKVGTSEKWRSFIKDLLKVAFECNHVVSCIVYNSSPEGHLPMDFSCSSSENGDEPQVTSQMVLLCSWRTVKEVSLLLGELSQRATISDNDEDNALLKEEQILAIGEHLTGLLSETKHRGAFEQAYVGFSKLAGRLWRCNTGQLHELPKKWLEDTLECISTNKSLSATRRSAGIPFIVQALICGEMESGSCKSLNKAMTYLLEIAKSGNDEGRIHALNILRALYRVSSLGEAVGPFVADGIVTAIAGFNSNTWAERNSSTLLLSALMSRVFGVPRGKSENLSWRNRMTGRLFFQRYPILYEVILSHLKASSKSQMYPALYPVLLILGRLYPSSLEGTDSNLQLMRYIPYIKKCAESSIFKTRSLAATAMVSLTTQNLFTKTLEGLKEDLSSTVLSKENHYHGKLLMIRTLFERLDNFEPIESEILAECVKDFTLNLKTNIDMGVKSKMNLSFISLDTMVQILLHLLSKFSLQRENSLLLLEAPLNCIMKNKFPFKDKSNYGYEIFHVHCSILLLLLYFHNRKLQELEEVICNLLHAENDHGLGVTLDFVCYILSSGPEKFIPDTHAGLALDLEDTIMKDQLRSRIKASTDIGEILVKRMLCTENHHEDLLKLMKTLQYLPIALEKINESTPTIQYFSKICRFSDHAIASYAIKCLNSCLSYQSEPLQPEDVAELSTMIYEFCDPEVDYYTRKAVAELLTNNFDTLLKNVSSTSGLKIWVSAVRLILDEHSEIRNLISVNLIGDVMPSKGLEVLFGRFVNSMSNMSSLSAGLMYFAIGGNYDGEDSEEFLGIGTVFDKGALNTYNEDLILNRLSCKHFGNLIEKRSNLLFTNIEAEDSGWIKDKMNSHGQSADDIIDNFRMTVDDSKDLMMLLPYRPSENKRLLQKMKLDNLMKPIVKGAIHK